MSRNDRIARNRARQDPMRPPSTYGHSIVDMEQELYFTHSARYRNYATQATQRFATYAEEIAHVTTTPSRQFLQAWGSR